MKKAELVRKITKRAGIPDSEAKIFFEVLLRKASKQLGTGDALKLKGFGSFQLKKAKIKNLSRTEEEPLYTKLFVYLPFDEDYEGKKLIFSIPSDKEEDYNLVDSYFSLSVGKPVIPLKGAKSSDMFFPPTGYELRRLIDSKVDKLIRDSEIIKNKSSEDATLLIDSESFNSNQYEIDWDNEYKNSPDEPEQVSVEDEEIELALKKQIENIPWDFGENLKKQIEEESSQEIEESEDDILSDDFISGKENDEWQFGEKQENIEEEIEDENETDIEEKNNYVGEEKIEKPKIEEVEDEEIFEDEIKFKDASETEINDDEIDEETSGEFSRVRPITTEITSKIDRFDTTTEYEWDANFGINEDEVEDEIENETDFEGFDSTEKTDEFETDLDNLEKPLEEEDLDIENIDEETTQTKYSLAQTEESDLKPSDIEESEDVKSELEDDELNETKSGETELSELDFDIDELDKLELDNLGFEEVEDADDYQTTGVEEVEDVDESRIEEINDKEKTTEFENTDEKEDDGISKIQSEFESKNTEFLDRMEKIAKKRKRFNLALLVVAGGALVILIGYIIFNALQNVSDKEEPAGLNFKNKQPVLVARTFDIPVNYPYEKNDKQPEFTGIDESVLNKQETVNQETSSTENKTNQNNEVKKEQAPKESPKPPEEKNVSVKTTTNELTRVEANIYKDGNLYVVQVSSWKQKIKAENQVNKYQQQGYNAFIQQAEIPGRGTWYRVRVGGFTTIEEAKNFQRSIK